MKNIAYEIEEPFNSLVEPAIQQWLLGQRIGIMAYWTMVGSLRERRDVTGVLGRSFHEYLGGADGLQKVGYLNTLPPAVLHLLNTLLIETPDNAPNNVKNQHDRIKLTLISLNKKSNKTPSLLNKANILSYHILNSRASAYRVCSLGASLVAQQSRRPWREILEEHTLLESINKHLELLRRPGTKTIAKLQAISELGSLLKRRIRWWSQVENILLTRTFYWPLLVSDTNRTSGFSLPIAIDIEFDNRNRADSVGDGANGDQGAGGIDVSPWDNHLKDAVNTAWIL